MRVNGEVFKKLVVCLNERTLGLTIKMHKVTTFTHVVILKWEVEGKYACRYVGQWYKKRSASWET